MSWCFFVSVQGLESEVHLSSLKTATDQHHTSSLCIAGNMPVATTLFSEFVSSQSRGRLMQLIVMCSPLGLLTVAITQMLLLDALGWRWLIFILSLPSSVALAMAWGCDWVQESPRWLLTQGEEAAARHILETWMHIEASEPVLVALARVQSPRIEPAQDGVCGLTYCAKTTLVWAVWFFAEASSASLGVWLPTLLLARMSHQQMHSVFLVGTLGAFVGLLYEVLLIDRVGRQLVASVSFMFAAGVSVLLIFTDSVTGCLLALLGHMCFVQAGWSTLYVLTPETYPTYMRGTAVGAASAISRIASLLAPLGASALVGVNTDYRPGEPEQVSGGVAIFLALNGLCFALAATLIMLLPDAKGHVLR